MSADKQVTKEDVAEEYTLSKYGQMANLYNEMCNEIARARNVLSKYENITPAPLATLPKQEYKKVVYVKVKGKKQMEVHSYVNSVEEDNATIIANVRKDMKEAKIDVENVFVVEKV